MFDECRIDSSQLLKCTHSMRMISSLQCIQVTAIRTYSLAHEQFFIHNLFINKSFLLYQLGSTMPVFFFSGEGGRINNGHVLKKFSKNGRSLINNSQISFLYNVNACEDYNI